HTSLRFGNRPATSIAAGRRLRHDRSRIRSPARPFESCRRSRKRHAACRNPGPRAMRGVPADRRLRRTRERAMRIEFKSVPILDVKTTHTYDAVVTTTTYNMADVRDHVVELPVTNLLFSWGTALRTALFV